MQHVVNPNDDGLGIPWKVVFSYPTYIPFCEGHVDILI